MRQLGSKVEKRFFFFTDVAESALMHRPVGSNLPTQATFTIHIANVPASLKKSGIANLCRKHGKVVNVDVCFVVSVQLKRYCPNDEDLSEKPGACKSNSISIGYLKILRLVLTIWILHFTLMLLP